MFIYKSFKGEYNWDWESGTFYGAIQQTFPVITFQGKNLGELEKDFKKAVDNYINKD